LSRARTTYPSFRYDQALVLEVPQTLWLVMVFLVRHLLLLGLTFMPRSGSAMSYLRDLELDWPGSRALLARLGVALAAQEPEGAHVVLGKCLSGALRAYRAARLARTGDQARFAAFLTGITDALAEPRQQVLVTQALSPPQERALRLAGGGDN
jgi:hypothetical protein